MESWREELYHSAKGTSWEKTNHKYIERKKVNGKWVYRYTDDSPQRRNEERSVMDYRYNQKTSKRREEDAEHAKRLSEGYSKLDNPVQANKYAREAEHQGRKKTEEEIDRMLNGNAEENYKRAHTIDYYKNKGEAFIERLLKKK